MKFTSTFVGAAVVAGLAKAQDTTPCEKYSMALFNESTGDTQLQLLTALVNTAVIGNYAPNAMNNVTGILNNGTTSDGVEVSLAKYFNGALVSSNRDGNPMAINFLDGGGAEPLMMNKAANDEDSNQYKLLTHLYQYFGALLGCNADGFPQYQGSTSQSAVHRYMNLNQDEVKYFIEQVGSAATSFGVTNDDVTMVANTLSTVFNVRCAPPMKLPASADTAASQSICLDSGCPLADNSTCASTDVSYGNGTMGEEPAVADSSNSGGSMGGNGNNDNDGSDSALGSMAVNALGALALTAAGVVALGF